MSGRAPVVCVTICALFVAGCGSGQDAENSHGPPRERPCWSPRAEPVPDNEPVCDTLHAAARAMLAEVSTVQPRVRDYLFDGRRLLWARTVFLPRPGLVIREWEPGEGRFVERFAVDFRSVPSTLGVVREAREPRVTVLPDDSVAACAVIRTQGADLFHCFVFEANGGRIEAMTAVTGGVGPFGLGHFRLASVNGKDLLLAWLQGEDAFYLATLSRSRAAFGATVSVEPTATGAGIDCRRIGSLGSIATALGPILYWTEELRVEEGTYPGDLRPLGPRLCFGLFENGEPPAEIGCEPLPDGVDVWDRHDLRRSPDGCVGVEAGRFGTSHRFAFGPHRHPPPLSDAFDALDPIGLPEVVIGRCIHPILFP